MKELFFLFIIIVFGDHLRPLYHYRPPKNWINDPNGPILYKGIYHLFAQYNPNGTVWGNMNWFHMVIL